MLREEIEMEKRCLFCTALTTLVILTATILFFIIYTGGEDICTSRRCVQTANELITSLDQSVDPCDDFYEFACGNVRRLLAQGQKKRTYDYDSNNPEIWDEDEDENERDYLSKAKTSSIRHMIEEPPNPYDTKSLSKIKTFYRSCAKTPRNGNETFSGITRDGIKAVLRDIGGWPMLERSNWREERFDWIAAVHYLRKTGIDENIFIQNDIVRNRYDSTKYILMIRISRDYLGSARINTEGDKKLFVEYIVEVASYFGVDRIRSQRDSYEIMEFFEQLKKIHEVTEAINRLWSNENISPSTENFNPRSLTQLQHDVPNMEWYAYINGIVGPSIQLTADEFVYAPNIDELKRLIDLLNKTPKKILANYLCWRFVQSYVAHLPDPTLHERLAKFGKFHPKRNRREICTRLIRNKMPEMVEACYVRNYVTDDVKRITKDIIESIKKELVKMADALDWLDADIKQVSKEKLASVRDYVAYTPEMPATISSTAEVYDQIDFDEDNFMNNLMRIQLARANIKYQKLRQPFEQHVYSEIEYSVINNNLVLPSDYLQAFYVDEARPLYMNFGILGGLIAYQLVNVFLEGKRYDVHGELREWSTSHSLFTYDNKTRCLTRQYEEFHMPGFRRNINASETQQDDVALLFGKLVAYKAYETYLKNHASEERLPGLQYSTKQLFWIASAMDECYQKANINANFPTPHPDYRSQAEKSENVKLPRSISKLRVVGPLRNSEDFARDFHCPIDSYMNPPEKCVLW